jgi:hypothetical protein
MKSLVWYLAVGAPPNGNTGKYNSKSERQKDTYTSLEILEGSW